ncbi:DUF6602 domain-containing protein [Pseudomonas luteola]|uniref:DUF6602 domain-containing protein n=1 Tax=Pseudomonas luteola TaxID=47886 RepID=UPI0015E322D5|nr:DUF6602 domain-containing protein [Pseudomonas zeshuii]MBA1250967.1 hypothetical protein [Pseudomonas zeshuii]
MTNQLYRNRILNDIAYVVREAKDAVALAHHGLAGRVRELVVSRLLAPMLPSGFEIGTGKITNAAGDLSQETDLVIYNRSILPPIFYSERDAIFPIESSYYAIEVKSTLTATEIKSSLAKGESITSLGGKNPADSRRHVSPTVLVLFAFSSDLAPASSEAERYAKYDPDWCTDPVFKAICVVGKGYWYHEAENSRWVFHSATQDHDEVVDLVSGVVNTLTKVPPASRISYLGHYLMSTRRVSFVGGVGAQQGAQDDGTASSMCVNNA